MRLVPFLDSSLTKFSSHAPIYPFTTERLDLSLQVLPVQGGRVCTVNGSGDQIINLALFGAREILSFDCNYYALWWAELKLVAIKLLDYNQFCQFFFHDHANVSNQHRVFSLKTYLALKSELSAEASNFFDQIFTGLKLSGLELRTSSLFTRRRDTSLLAIRCNLYLQNRELYRLARQKLSQIKVSFLNLSAELLAPQLKENYDLILLSNLADYAHLATGSKIGALANFVDTVVKPISTKISSNGTLAVAYIYETQSKHKSDYRSEIDRPEIRKRILEQNFSKVVEVTFSGVAQGTFDSLIMVGYD